MTDSILRAGVVGWPIGRSLSPMLHTHWLKALEIAGDYEGYAVEPERFETDLATLANQGLRGVNVTAPLKERALAYATSASAAATGLGAANLLLFTDGEAVADNTDAQGWAHGLEQARRTTVSAALILGAAGAARAAALGALKAGADVVWIAARDPAKAARAASLVNAEASSGEARGMAWSRISAAAAACDVIVNATPMGHDADAPLDLKWPAGDGDRLFYDLNYGPQETHAVQAARAAGLTAVDGLAMLIGQAIPSFEAFFGARPPQEAIASAEGVLRGAQTTAAA